MQRLLVHDLCRVQLAVLTAAAVVAAAELDGALLAVPACARDRCAAGSASCTGMRPAATSGRSAAWVW